MLHEIGMLQETRNQFFHRSLACFCEITWASAEAREIWVLGKALREGGERHAAAGWVGTGCPQLNWEFLRLSQSHTSQEGPKQVRSCHVQVGGETRTPPSLVFSDSVGLFDLSRTSSLYGRKADRGTRGMLAWPTGRGCNIHPVPSPAGQTKGRNHNRDST